MDRHNEVLAGVSRQVRSFYERKRPFRIYHGGSNSTRPPAYVRDSVVDTSQLSRILKIDTQEPTALAEPNVSMASLVEATLQEGLIPPVVLEFPAITVGGAFAGTAGESSSFKHGLFDSTVSWIEIVLADGTVTTASHDENQDLLRGAAGSCGTLGVVTLLRVRLMPAAQYVELTYYPIKSTAIALKKIEEKVADPLVQYLDGVMFKEDRGVVMVGRLTDTVSRDTPIQTFSRARDPWFYRFTEKALSASTDEPFTVAIPVVDYVFRWNRGAFWGGLYAFRYFVTPLNRITRFMLNPFMNAKTMFHALQESGIAGETFVQDMGVPLERTEEFLLFLHDLVAMYPLWLCPVRHNDASTSSFQLGRSKTPSGQMINVGIWGPGPKDRLAFRLINREFESKCHELGGFKCLYARTYYTEGEFWDIYDKEAYTSLREKYNAATLPTVYDKVKPPKLIWSRSEQTWKHWLYEFFWSIWPLSGLYGVICVILGSEFLLKGSAQQGSTKLASICW